MAVFSQVVQAGSYRLASEVLNVTPSALSQTIAALEYALGVSLFHRIGKRLVLTEEGEHIQREFHFYYSALTQALSQATLKADQVSGLLRIGAYLEFAKFQLAPIVSSFQKQFPDVQLKLTFDTPSRLHRMLEAGKLDVCFSIYPERDSKLIRSKPIYKEELLLVAPHGKLSERPTFEDVTSTPIIEYYMNHQPIRRWLMLQYKKKPKHLPICTYGATAEMVLALIQQGLGIGMVPEYLLGTKTAKMTAICRPSPRKLIDHIWMLQLKGQRPSAALESFTQAVENGLGRNGR